MNGDKVILSATGTEENGEVVYTSEASLKPQFMLDEEYNEHIINCAIIAVQTACRACFPNNSVAQRMLAENIAKTAVQDGITIPE